MLEKVTKTIAEVLESLLVSGLISLEKIEEARKIIISRAKSKLPSQQTISYLKLVTLAGLGLDLGNPWHRKLLSDLLFVINLREYVEERPLLSAIVLHEGGSEPGVGFFKLAEFLDLDCSDRDKFHSEEMTRVIAYWRTNECTSLRLEA